MNWNSKVFEGENVRLMLSDVTMWNKNQTAEALKNVRYKYLGSRSEKRSTVEPGRTPHNAYL